MARPLFYNNWEIRKKEDPWGRDTMFSKLARNITSTLRTPFFLHLFLFRFVSLFLTKSLLWQSDHRVNWPLVRWRSCKASEYEEQGLPPQLQIPPGIATTATNSAKDCHHRYQLCRGSLPPLPTLPEIATTAISFFGDCHYRYRLCWRLPPPLPTVARYPNHHALSTHPKSHVLIPSNQL